MPKPEPAIDAKEATTVTRRWTAAGFVVEAIRGDKGEVTVTLAKHSGAHMTCPKCDRQNQVPPQALSAAELDGLIRLLSTVRDVKIAELEKYGAADA